MQLIITMAGNGRRIATVSPHIPKELLPLSAELIDGYYDCALTRIISFARESGVDRLYGVVPPHASLDFYRQTFGIECTQAAPKGEAFAVSEARNKLELVEGMLICSADNVFSRHDFLGFVRAASKLNNDDSLIAVEPKSSVSRYTEVILGPNHKSIIALVEKPQHGKPGLAKSGLYYVSGPSAERCFATASTDRFGEWSMTEALKHLDAVKFPIEAYTLRDGFQDIGTPSSYRDAVAS